ncbi:MAG: gfo/Idh/MocA family oxidoreductase [Mucilaginibacter sp.]|jgi:UDP-N-acetyl-2-amino-2-deoxyglucuronate dehydrogenase|nr:gfo/Idh/MocA family oxidoreductase [Mucilaginibacter sp.]
MISEKLKFAVVGCGSIGKRHIAVINAEPEAELIAICDIDEDKCKQLSALYNDIPYYTSIDDLLKRSDIDIVNIATPHGLHAGMSIQAAQSGKHILVEKPMALVADDCEKMISAANDNGVKLFVVKQNRYNTPISLAKKAIDEKKLGKLFMVQCNVMWNRHQEYYNESDWRGRLDLEGGALHTQVSHFIDLLIWYFGDLVEAKTLTDTMNHSIEIEDCGVSALKFKSGVIGSLFWTTCVYNKNYEGSITIIGEKGTIKIGGKYLNKIEFWDVQSYPLPEGIDFEDQPNNYGKYQGTSSNHDKVIHHLVDQFNRKRNGVVEGDEAIKTIKAIDKIYKG